MGDDHDQLTRLTERLRGYEAARVLQAAEYERRLAELNHAHEQAREKEREYVRLDVFNSYVREQAAREEKAAEALRLEVKTAASTLATAASIKDERLMALENWRNRAVGVFLVLVPIAGVVGAAIVRLFGG